MKKAVIIGAGPAGLTAAYELLRQSNAYEVVILERSGEIGGISRTVHYGNNRMDIGGHRFFSKDKQVCDWWNAMMPDQGAPSYDNIRGGRTGMVAPQGPDPEKEDRVMLMRNRVSRIYYKRHFYDYPLSMKPQNFLNMGLLTTVRAGSSYLCDTVFKREEKSLEDFYVNRFGRMLYSMFFEGYTEKLWGRHPRDIAPDWGSQRVKGLSIRALLADAVQKAFGGEKKRGETETSLIESFRYPKYGPGQLWEITAAEVERLGGKLVKQACVKHITVKNGRVTQVTAQCGDRTQAFDCDVLFSSMPLKDLIAGMDQVPETMMQIADGLPYRDFVTVGVLVDHLALKNETKLQTLNHMIPDCWIYVQDTGVKLGRIQVFNNWSPYLVEDPEKTVWLGLEFFCREGDAFWNMSEENCAQLGIDELKKIGVLDEHCSVLDFHRERVQKAYPAYFDTYSRLGELREYLDGFENLYCIGRNGQHRYNNMDHSMETAFAAVKAELGGSRDKNAVWNVNTETDYHEGESSCKK